MPTTLRLTFKLHRFELAALAVIALWISVGALAVAVHLDSLGVPRACFRSGATGPLDCRGMSAFYDAAGRETSALRPLAGVLPFLVGLFLGVPLVGRELEHGTSRLAWSLAPSRTRWFLVRLGALAFVTLLLLAGPALAIDRLEGSSNPGADPWRTFSDFGLRGLAPLGWGFAALSIGALAGSIVGRTLPALIVAGVLCAGAWVAIDEGMTRWLRTEAVALSDVADPASSRFLGMRYREVATGELLVPAELEAHVPPERANDGNWLDANYPAVPFGIPGARYREVDLRVAGIALGLSSAAVCLGLVVTVRRRP